jgi:hypothetical protein
VFVAKAAGLIVPQLIFETGIVQALSEYTPIPTALTLPLLVNVRDAVNAPNVLMTTLNTAITAIAPNVAFCIANFLSPNQDYIGSLNEF